MKTKWFRRNWLWVIIAIAVVVVTFCICISIFRETPFAGSVLNFFKDWSVALSAAAAVILACAAFMTIRHSNEQEKRRRKERLLNEIIDWATDILESGRVPDILYEMRIREVKARKSEEALKHAMTDDLRYRLNRIAVRSIYLKYIVTAFNQTLRDAVEQAKIRVDQQIELLKLVGRDKATPESVGRHRKLLDESAKTVISEAINVISPIS